MQPRGPERYAPLTGVVFLALVIPSFIVPGESPSADDKLPKVLHYWQTHDTRAIVSSLLGGIALIFLLWFLGSLRSALRVAEGADGRLSAIAFAGGLIVAAGAAVGISLQFAAADTVGDVAPTVTQTLSVLNSDFYLPFPVGIFTLLVATALVAFRTGVLPRWLAWISVVIAIAAVTPVGFFAFLAWFIWVAVVAVLLYRSGGAAAPTAAATPAGTTPY